MDSTNDTSFGRNLYKYRTLRGDTQHTLAGRCGLSDKFISDLETSRKQPSYDAAKRLAEALEISLDLLTYDANAATGAANDDLFIKEALMYRSKMSDKKKKMADYLGLKLLEEIMNYPDE